MSRPKKTKAIASALENESGNEIDSKSNSDLPAVEDVPAKSIKRSQRLETKSQIKKPDYNEEDAEPVKKIVKKRSKKADQEVKSLEEEPPIKKGRTKKTTTAIDKTEQLVESQPQNSLNEEDKELVVKKGSNKKAAKNEENRLEVPKSRGRRAKTPQIIADVSNHSVEFPSGNEIQRKSPAVQEPKARGRKKAATIEVNTEQVLETKQKKSSKVSKTNAAENETQENRLEVPKSRGRGAKTPPIIAGDLSHSVEILPGNGVNNKSPAVQEPKARAVGRKKKEATEDIETKNDKPIKPNVPVAKKDTKSIEKQNEQTAAVDVKKKRGAAKAPELEEHVQVLEKEAKQPAKSRGRKRAVVETIDQNEDESEIDGAKPAKTKKPAIINTTETIYNKADFELEPVINGGGSNDKRFNLKVSSWNVAGLRAWLKKDGLKFLDYEEPDIFCLQETKCVNDQLPEEMIRIPGYHPYWLCKPGGYAGVAVYSKIMPINVEYGIGHEEFDDVGRMITAEYEKFYLINVYVPNSGRKLVNLDMRMRWEMAFQAYVKKLDSLKPVVICGDMNVSHLEIDLANPKSNTRNAGFTKEERDKMTELLALGFVDTFRNLYPTRTGAYTFWTYMANARARNVGWRLDYFIVSERFKSRIVDNCIRSQCKGSDHCPITLFMKL